MRQDFVGDAQEYRTSQEADKRADIWAFGVLLWEMLAGQSLFAGDTVSDTLAEVLKDAGFTTGAAISAFVLDSQFGTDQGFDSTGIYFNGHQRSLRMSAVIIIEFIDTQLSVKLF